MTATTETDAWWADTPLQTGSDGRWAARLRLAQDETQQVYGCPHGHADEDTAAACGIVTAATLNGDNEGAALWVLRFRQLRANGWTVAQAMAVVAGEASDDSLRRV